jgi:hypothetical protein
VSFAGGPQQPRGRVPRRAVSPSPRRCWTPLFVADELARSGRLREMSSRAAGDAALWHEDTRSTPRCEAASSAAVPGRQRRRCAQAAARADGARAAQLASQLTPRQVPEMDGRPAVVSDRAGRAAASRGSKLCVYVGRVAAPREEQPLPVLGACGRPAASRPRCYSRHGNPSQPSCHQYPREYPHGHANQDEAGQPHRAPKATPRSSKAISVRVPGPRARFPRRPGKAASRS